MEPAPSPSLTGAGATFSQGEAVERKKLRIRTKSCSTTTTTVVTSRLSVQVSFFFAHPKSRTLFPRILDFVCICTRDEYVEAHSVHRGCQLCTVLDPSSPVV
jgi:hypothetical protein